jgi:hypothetical protein
LAKKKEKNLNRQVFFKFCFCKEIYNKTSPVYAGEVLFFEIFLIVSKFYLHLPRDDSDIVGGGVVISAEPEISAGPTQVVGNVVWVVVGYLNRHSVMMPAVFSDCRGERSSKPFAVLLGPDSSVEAVVNGHNHCVGVGCCPADRKFLFEDEARLVV